MRILYLITGLRMGGAEKQLLILAKHMQLAGNEVMVVSMESGGVIAAEMRLNRISVIELAMSRGGSLAAGYSKFKSVIQAFIPDIIHSHMIHANLFARIFKLFNSKYKLINTAHNIQECGNKFMQLYRFTKFIPNWSTNVSKEAFQHYVVHQYFNSKKASYLPNAIDTAAFKHPHSTYGNLRKQLGIADGHYLFLTSGRLHEQKNHQLLLKAFKVVQQSFDRSNLIIVGEGPLENLLKKMSTDLGIKDKVIFLGRRDDMPALMNMCDCFVLSSIYEGFGMVVGEAMAAQKPVIATDCGGVAEVMGGFGKLVTINNADELANAMMGVYQQPYTCEYLNSARQHIVNNYAIPYVVEQWKQLYNRRDL